MGSSSVPPVSCSQKSELTFVLVHRAMDEALPQYILLASVSGDNYDNAERWAL